MTTSASSVGVVIPTRNSERTLSACLNSLREQSLRPVIVVVDNYSSDGTLAIAQELADIVLQAGPERSAQRNRGSEAVPDASVLGFIDSDMILSTRVVEEAVDKLREGAAAVVVPEVTIGTGYWTNVRRYERDLYQDCNSVEAARFFDASAFRSAGGFDESLTGPEDWAMAEAVARFGTVSRIVSVIEHDEGHLSYLDACRKKGHYALGLQQYAKSRGAKMVLNHLLDRPWLRNPTVLLRSPYGPGLVALKSGEVLAVGAALAGRLADRRIT